MIDHVTYQVPKGMIGSAGITEFFELLEFEEIQPDEYIEKGWDVRWFRPEDTEGYGGAIIHLVEPKQFQMRDNSRGELVPGLNHFCKYVTPERYAELDRGHPMVKHNNPDTDRLWLDGPYGLRCEVRSFANVYDNAACPKISAPVLGWTSAEVIKAEDEFIEAQDRELKVNVTPAPSSAVRPGLSSEEITEGAKKLARVLKVAGFGEDPIEIQSNVLTEALDIYKVRNDKYQDNWKRMGLKGMVFRVRERAERAWDIVFGPNDVAAEELRDDLIDLINFAAFAVRALDSKNTDGTWFGE